MNETSINLTKAIARILRPLVRILLRHGVAFNALSDLIKNLYLEIAEREFALPGKKQSISRISTLTGLTRKEVTKAKTSEELDLNSRTQQYNRAARVISGWVRDPDFQNKNQEPAELVLEEGERSFQSLVRRFSGDIPPRAIADELIRVGAIEQTPNGNVKLVQRAYIPEKDIDEKLNILGTDVSDLLETIYHNIHIDTAPPFFQRKVSYDAIPKKLLVGLREELNKNAQGYLEKLDKIMSKKDSDMNPRLSRKGNCRAGVGIYYFEEIPDNE